MTDLCHLVRIARVRLAGLLYDITLTIAPADNAAMVRQIMADGRDITIARQELAEMNTTPAEEP